ncbi:hypothetical protein KIPB_007903, partial [Kipferlia bialata]
VPTTSRMESSGFGTESPLKRGTHRQQQQQQQAEAAHAQHEHKIRQIEHIVLGPYEMETWYHSPYPDEYGTCSKLHLCEFCLKPAMSDRTAARHRQKCPFRCPPGNEIYRNDRFSFFEVDGRVQKAYCRNLCMLAKLFLDHKELVFDVDLFLFYPLCQVSDDGYHLVGRVMVLIDFSYMLVVLIDFSYMLASKEQRLGGPETPLSDLGIVSFYSYWKDRIVAYVAQWPKNSISMNDIVRGTNIQPKDVLRTLEHFGILTPACKGERGHFVFYIPPDLRKSALDKLHRAPQMSIERLHWSPYHNMERNDRDLLDDDKV